MVSEGNGNGSAFGTPSGESPNSSPAQNSKVPRIRESRMQEPHKFIPMVFVLWIISSLYLIFTCCHIYRLLQLDREPELREATELERGWTQAAIFQFITVLLLLSYVRCALTNPGEIPNEPAWIYNEDDDRPSPETQAVTELKRTGLRRHCKWCGRYKPDRCHHCRVCRICILKMDHHCPWIYNCVGYFNHKYFFLVLFYSLLDCILIAFCMMESVMASTEDNSTFLQMFLLLFGCTLAGFMGLLIGVFWMFHVWLMMKAMTTIEFCEKAMKRSGYNASQYDDGLYNNFKSVLGPRWWLWFLPLDGPDGDGIIFGQKHSERMPLIRKQAVDGRL